MSFDFATGIDEQPAINWPIEERNPGFIIQIDKASKVWISGYKATSPASALLIHESTYAFIYWRKLFVCSKSDAILWVEEHATATFRNRRVAEVASLEVYVRRNTGSNGVRMRILYCFRRNVGGNYLGKLISDFLLLGINKNLLPYLFRRRSGTLARSDARSTLARNDSRITLY